MVFLVFLLQDLMPKVTMVSDTNIAVQSLRQKPIVMKVKYQLGVDMKTLQSDQITVE